MNALFRSWVWAAAWLVCAAGGHAAEPDKTTAAAPPPPAATAPVPPPKAAPADSKTVPSTDVSRVQAWKDAERVAQMGEGRVSAAGAGGSMQPVFGSNTMIVISKIAYEDLKPGMTVAYLNKKGRQIVHQILEKKAKGWRVQGLNNETEDLELVTRENLLGVVYASFVAEEP